MKTLMLFIALTASVWSSFSYSESLEVYISRFSNEGSTYNNCSSSNVCYQTFYMPVSATNDDLKTQYLFQITNITYSNKSCHMDGPSRFFRCPEASSLRSYFTFTATNSPAEPTQTCKTVEGAFIDGYHNSENDFCAIVGSTGGSNPQPLMCVAKNLAEIPANSGNFQHTISANDCNSPTGPIAPDGDGTDPGEPCTENCEPTNPETPPGGGDDGSEIPDTGGGSNSSNTSVTGSITDSQGNITNINLTMDQDFSPITNRQNETNERLKAENQNSSTIIDRLNDIIKGGTDNGKKLDGIKDAITGLGEGEDTDLSGIEGKLDGIKEGIDGIKDGMGTSQDGEDAANNVDLPDVEKAINDGYDAIMDAINSDANNQVTDGLQNVGTGLTAFESIPQIFALASENCGPLNFGDIRMDLCPYASTSSYVLTWVLTILTIIFIVFSVVSDIKKIRMT
ncbi:hypothetical protein SAMN05660691_02446 [Rheinheimera pacifica]|uniref:Uncharacterized protein n=1 Tax=Rheinheimera pacifica TaxID=173990 RepID=A0A1H6M5N3_9GAMM|nr:hypothetical protein [Rheinheimera pacifica]SEH96536.1 hypothetical protein SAMN05660691_02446 [Rheinheimera pacifica]